MTKHTMSAGFLPSQGSKANGIGFELEKSPTLRPFDMGGDHF